MLASFTVIGSIASTTRKFANYLRAQAIRNFIFDWKKLGISVGGLKQTVVFTKWKVF